MAIDIVDDILKHDEEDVIRYLYEKMVGVSRIYAKACESGDPSLLYCATGDLNDVRVVLKEIVRRNEKKAL